MRRKEQLLVRGKSEPADSTSKPFQGMDVLSSAEVPEFDLSGQVNVLFRCAAARQELAIRGERDSLYRLRMTAEVARLRGPGDQVPHDNGSARAADSQPRSVGRDRNGLDLAGVAIALEVFKLLCRARDGYVPNADGIVPPSRRQMPAIRRERQGIHLIVMPSKQAVRRGRAAVPDAYALLI